jgi:hypothetical protein
VPVCPVGGVGQSRSQLPTFQAGVALVPIDVRATDTKTGRPVTDLKQEEFSVFEDGVP